MQKIIFRMFVYIALFPYCSASQASREDREEKRTTVGSPPRNVQVQEEASPDRVKTLLEKVTSTFQLLQNVSLHPPTYRVILYTQQIQDCEEMLGILPLDELPLRASIHSSLGYLYHLVGKDLISLGGRHNSMEIMQETFEEAILFSRRAWNVYPENIEISRTLANALLIGARTLEIILRGMPPMLSPDLLINARKKIVRYYKEIHVVFPSLDPHQESLAVAYNDLGAALFSTKGEKGEKIRTREKAIAYLRKAQKLLPTNEQIGKNLGTALLVNSLAIQELLEETQDF